MAIKFETNIPLMLRFPYGDSKEVNGQYGQQFMYTVEVDGLRDRLYATLGLHHKLQDAGLGPGAVFTITKIEVDGNRKDWRVEAQGQNGKAAWSMGEQTVSDEVLIPNGHSEAPIPDPGGEQPAPETLEFEQLRQAMQHCLIASYGAWARLETEVPYSSEDVRAVGITLFLECSRKGIVPVAAEEGLPF